MESEDRNLWDAFYHSCFGEIPIPELFINFVEKSQLSKKLREFLISQPNKPENFDTRYLIQSYLKLLGEKIEDNSREIVISDLSKSQDQVVTQILPYLLNNKKINKKDDGLLHNIGFFLLLFRETFSGAFYTLYPEVQKLINEITYESLFSILGPDFFTLMKEIPEKFLSTFPIDVHAIAELFKSDLVISNVQVCDIIQKRVAKKYNFPNQFPFISDLYFTCMNTTIVESKSIFDLLTNLAIDDIVSADFEKLLTHFNGFQELIPYYLAANQQLIYSNLEMMTEIISTEYVPSIASDLVTRFRNDQRLLEMISFCNGGDLILSPADLMDASLVFHLQNVIGNSEIMEYAENKYFLVSDIDADNDFDFIRCYSIFRNYFSTFNSPPASTKKYLDQIAQTFKEIKTDKIREAMTFDLFSLLFLKKDDKFVTNTAVAKAILKVINSGTEDKYINAAHSLLCKNFTFWRQDPPFESYMTRDPTNIFKAVEDKNWQLANELTTGIPYYRNIYILSCSVDAMINNKTLPDESQEFSKLLNLEVGFSTYAYDLLKASAKIFPQYKEIIEKRSFNVFDLLQNENWQAINAFLEVFDSLENFDDFLITIEKSANLFSFISDVNYYNRYSNYENGFDYIRAISNAIQAGNYDDAKEMSKIIGKDLIEVILLNITYFDITKEFILSQFSLNPLIMTIIAVSEFGTSILSELPGISKEVKKYMKQKIEEENKPDIKKLFDMFRENNLDFEDLIFNIDHLRILKDILCTNIINDAIVAALDIVEYCANESEMDEINQIRLKHFAMKYENLNQSEKAVQAVKSLPRRLALNIIKKTEDYYVKEGLILIYENNKSDTQFVNELLKISEYHCNLINEHRGIYKDKNETNQNDTIHIALRSLPPEFKNPKDPSEAQKTLKSNPDLLLFINAENRVLFDNQFIMEVIDQVKSTKKKEKLINHALHFVARKVITDYVDQIFKMVIKTFVVKNINSEDRAFILLRGLMKLEKYSSMSDKIDLVNKFIERRIYSVSNRTYDFSKFDTDEFGNYFIDLCNDCDFYDICEGISSSYGIPKDVFNLSIVHKLMILGLYKELNSIDISDAKKVENFKLKGWTNTVSPFLDYSTLFIIPFIHYTPFPSFIATKLLSMQVTADIQKLSTKILHYVREIVKFESTPGYSPSLFDGKEKNIEKQDVMNKMIYVLSKFSSKNDAVSILTNSGNFQPAYQLLHSIGDDMEKKKAFIFAFFIPGIARDKTMDMMNFIKSQDPNLVLAAELFDALIDYANDSHLNECLYFVYSFRNMLEHQATAALNLFSSAKTMIRKVDLTGKAYASLDMAIMLRASPINLVPQYVPTHTSNSDLKETLSIINLQMQFCQFCLSKTIDVKTDDMDLFHNPACAAKMAAALSLSGHENELYKQLISTFNVTDHDIEEGYRSVVKTKKVDEVYGFLSTMKAKNPVLCTRVMTSYLKYLCFTKDFFWIPMFIRLDDDPERQAKLFIEYDLLDDANAVIMQNNLTDLNDILAIRASQTACLMVMLRYRNNQ